MTNKNQQVGNIGLYYVAYRLTQKGFSVFPTIRNAKGADMYVIDKENSARAIPIQIKTLSKKSPVPFGISMDRDELYLFLVVDVNNPELYFAEMSRVKDDIHKGVNDAGKVSYWLQPDKWEKYDQDLELFPFN